MYIHVISAVQPKRLWYCTINGIYKHIMTVKNTVIIVLQELKCCHLYEENLLKIQSHNFLKYYWFQCVIINFPNSPTLSSAASCLSFKSSWKRRKASIPIGCILRTRQTACNCWWERLSRVISSSKSFAKCIISSVVGRIPWLRICIDHWGSKAE